MSNDSKNKINVAAFFDNSLAWTPVGTALTQTERKASAAQSTVDTLALVDMNADYFLSYTAYDGFVFEVALQRAQALFGKFGMVLAVLYAVLGTNTKRIGKRRVSVMVSGTATEMSHNAMCRNPAIPFFSSKRDLVKPDDLNPARLGAVYATNTVFALFKMNHPGSMPEHSCPGFLQFPSALGVKMSPAALNVHLDWSRQYRALAGMTENNDLEFTIIMSSRTMSNVLLTAMGQEAGHFVAAFANEAEEVKHEFETLEVLMAYFQAHNLKCPDRMFDVCRQNTLFCASHQNLEPGNLDFRENTMKVND